MEQNLDENKLFRYKIYDWLIDWSMFNVQRPIFQLYSGRTRTLKNLNATGLETRKGVWVGTDNLASATGLIMSILLIMSCYSTLGSLTCEEDGNLSTRDLGFIYVSSEGRVGCEFIHPAQPSDAPSSRRISRSHFYIPGFPRGYILYVIQLSDRVYNVTFPA